MADLSTQSPMAPYARHIFICTGRFCDPTGKAAELYCALPALLGNLGRYDNPCRVKRSATPCLGVCSGGPLAVVYPDGIWYRVPDEAALQRIVEEHLRDNQPVEALIFHRLPALDPVSPCDQEKHP
jgi:(2Fe-2S) ferredoxin